MEIDDPFEGQVEDIDGGLPDHAVDTPAKPDVDDQGEHLPKSGEVKS